MDEQAEVIVEAMGRVHGVHAGFRAAHAKGTCCTGTFVASPDAARVCRAPHFTGEEIPVTVRFSNGSGKPTRADGARDERGMAVKFHIPDGRSTDVVSLTLPVFFVRTPEDFLAFLEVQRPDPETGKPDLARLEAFVNEHPEMQTAIGYSMFSQSPASYANCTFHAIHAFEMTGVDGGVRFVRYRWLPHAGAATLSDEETRALGREYLAEELERRVGSGPVVWDLLLQIAGEGDDPNDPTMAWPEERELVEAGRLSLTGFTGKDCDALIFDPGRVIEGIDTTDDPIIHARSAAYSVSYDRRTNG